MLRAGAVFIEVSGVLGPDLKLGNLEGVMLAMD
jgi:hypothetical protein